MKIVLMILLLIASIVLIASILFQSGNSAGLSGSIGGGAGNSFRKKEEQRLRSNSQQDYSAVGAVVFSSAPLFLRQLNNLYRRAEVYFCRFFLIVSHIRAKSFAFDFNERLPGYGMSGMFQSGKCVGILL